jgi:NAD+ kinase
MASSPRIGLILHPRRDCSGAIEQIAAWTSTHGIELVAGEADVARLGLDDVTPVSVEDLAGTAEGLIALGGDGTLLGAMRLVADRPIPVLGVNFGRLGFLAEVEGTELAAALQAMAEGGVTTEWRSALDVHIRGERHVVFNDAVLTRVPGAGLVEATLSVAGQRHGNYRCDALILATAMGSTAYNYAAGGPVVSPGAAVVLVTPSAALNGISHTLVLGPDEPLRLDLTAGEPALELDGVLTGRLGAGTLVEVALRPNAGQLVRITGSLAAARKQVKLSLLDLPLLPQELAELLPAPLRSRHQDDDDPGSAIGPAAPA